MEWMEGLSDELKSDDGLKKFENVEALAKSYKHLESLNGSSIRIPGPDASEDSQVEFYTKLQTAAPKLMLRPDPESPEQMKEYYSMLGVPDDVEGYTYDGNLDETTLADLKQVALKSKFSREQFKEYAKTMDEASGFIQQNNEDSRIRQGAELKTEWGMAFEDRYAVVEKFASEHPGIGEVGSMSPAQMKEYYGMAVALTGQHQISGQPDPQGRLTPDEARERISEIDRNPLYMSTDPSNRAEHMRLVKQRIELLRVSNPSKYA